MNGPQPQRGQDLGLVLGGVAIVLGAWLLAANLGFVPPFVSQWFDLWSRVVGPLVLVFIGVIVIVVATQGLPRPSMPGKGRRLYRSRNERILAGVCGGLAAHVGVAPTFVRLAFVLAALLFGPIQGTIAYAALAWVMPEEPAPMPVPPASGA